jgi:hypothetical protein
VPIGNLGDQPARDINTFAKNNGIDVCVVQGTEGRRPPSRRAHGVVQSRLGVVSNRALDITRHEEQTSHGQGYSTGEGSRYERP